MDAVELMNKFSFEREVLIWTKILNFFALGIVIVCRSQHRVPVTCRTTRRLRRSRQTTKTSIWAVAAATRPAIRRHTKSSAASCPGRPRRCCAPGSSNIWSIPIRQRRRRGSWPLKPNWLCCRYLVHFCTYYLTLYFSFHQKWIIRTIDK